MVVKSKSLGGRSPKPRWNIRDIQLACMAGLGVAFLAVFAYLPMSGILLAFKNGDKQLDLLYATFYGEWTLKNFEALFGNEVFWQVFWNTVKINIWMLLINFPTPIIFALLLNEVRSLRLKKGIQTVCNFPQFISWVIYGGIVLALTEANTGVVNPVLELLGLSSPENPVDLNLAQYFYPKIIIASMLKGVGWGSIIYTAAIAGIDPSLYEAAMIDGANRWQRVKSITYPMIKPTIMIFLLLNVSGLLSNSFEQFYVFERSYNRETTRVLATYIYTEGMALRNYSYATALSLFEGLISVGLLLGSNYLSKKVTGEGIF